MIPKILLHFRRLISAQPGYVRSSLRGTELCSKRSISLTMMLQQVKLNIPRDSVQSAIRKLKSDDDTGPIVLIKAYKTANYGNFVDILDEMSIIGIARYTFVDINWIEEKMVETTLGITPSASPQK